MKKRKFLLSFLVSVITVYVLLFRITGEQFRFPWVKEVTHAAENIPSSYSLTPDQNLNDEFVSWVKSVGRMCATTTKFSTEKPEWFPSSYEGIASLGSAVMKLAPPSLISSKTGFEVFVNPHIFEEVGSNSENNFRRYNLEFLDWLHAHVEEILRDDDFVSETQGFFDQYLRTQFIRLRAAHESLQAHPSYLLQRSKSLRNRLSYNTSETDANPADYSAVEATYNTLIPHYLSDTYYHYNDSTFIEFWIRREVDGSFEALNRLIELVIATYL